MVGVKYTYFYLPTKQGAESKAPSVNRFKITNMIMVGVKYTDIYLPFFSNTYLFWVFDYENNN